MSNKYPSPCQTCPNQCSIDGNYDYSKNCKKYANWICWWWLEFKRQVRATVVHVKKPTCFAYRHPDEYREYLRNGPCKWCKAEEFCDLPCKAYLSWWNTRMEIIRKKVQG